jgi:molecular chaperone GrpE
MNNKENKSESELTDSSTQADIPRLNTTEETNDPGTPTDPLEDLKSTLETVEQEREHFKSIAQRTQADFSNYKKRVDEERVEMKIQAASTIISNLLPIIDDFLLALDTSVPVDNKKTPWYEGMHLIHKKLISILESEGVSRIEAENKIFDPWEHDALGQEETSNVPDGTIIKVIRHGYKINNKVLRPTQVIISKTPSLEENLDTN